MQIRHKIFLGYLLIVAVAVVMVTGFLLTLANINARYKDVLNREQLVMEANALRASVRRETMAVRAAEQLQDTNADLLDEYKEALQEQQQAIVRMRPLLTGEQDAQALAAIQRGAQEYFEVAQRAMNRAGAGQENAVLDLTSTDNETARQNLMRACDAFIADKSQDVIEGQM